VMEIINVIHTDVMITIDHVTHVTTTNLVIPTADVMTTTDHVIQIVMKEEIDIRECCNKFLETVF
jgi:hypothetical protein